MCRRMPRESTKRSCLGLGSKYAISNPLGKGMLLATDRMGKPYKRSAQVGGSRDGMEMLGEDEGLDCEEGKIIIYQLGTLGAGGCVGGVM